MSDESPPAATPPAPAPDAPRQRRGRRQTKRGKRAVDLLLSGQGAEQPAHFLRGRAPDAEPASFEETFGKEQPKLPDRLPDGTEIALTEKQRTMLAMALAGRTTSEIARAVGMTIPAVRNLFAGRTSTHVRETFRVLLEASGIDAVSLVAKARELLSATRPHWNPELKAFELFPDYSTQLGTWRPLVQLLGFMPAKAAAEHGSGPAVIIATNLGDGIKAPESENTLSITVGHRGPREQDGRLARSLIDAEISEAEVLDAQGEPSA